MNWKKLKSLPTFVYADGIGVDYGGSSDATGGGLRETVKLMISNNAM